MIMCSNSASVYVRFVYMTAAITLLPGIVVTSHGTGTYTGLSVLGFYQHNHRKSRQYCTVMMFILELSMMYDLTCGISSSATASTMAWCCVSRLYQGIQAPFFGG